MAGTVAVPPLLPLLAPLAGCFYTLRLEKHRLEAVLAVLGRKAGEVLGMVPLDPEAARRGPALVAGPEPGPVSRVEEPGRLQPRHAPGAEGAE